jgi:cleavage stimulation factor subunit 2
LSVYSGRGQVFYFLVFNQVLITMASGSGPKMHSVFVGNLTFHTTEEQLRDVFNTVGPTCAIRIVTDKETGRPKGYAFIQYEDPALALSAIRNLNGVELNHKKV